MWWSDWWDDQDEGRAGLLRISSLIRTIESSTCTCVYTPAHLSFTTWWSHRSSSAETMENPHTRLVLSLLLALLTGGTGPCEQCVCVCTVYVCVWPFGYSMCVCVWLYFQYSVCVTILCTVSVWRFIWCTIVLCVGQLILCIKAQSGLCWCEGVLVMGWQEQLRPGVGRFLIGLKVSVPVSNLH